MKFEQLGLAAPILKAVLAQGYEKPSPIQAQAIPPILEGKDVLAAAQTGTGKTAGFTLPLLHRLNEGQRARNNQIRALVLTPTRELAAQVGESVATYGAELPLRSEVVFGGVKINPQMMRLRGGADVLVATPGRLLDLYQQNAIQFKSLEVLVLDEADRMLDMGFIHDIRKILAILPEKRQNLLFSATFSPAIKKLAATVVRNPVEVSVAPANSTSKQVKQWLHPVDKKRKADLLISLVQEHDWQQVLVFSRTKHGANRLAKKLEGQEITAAAIHGNKSQGARTRALANFKSGEIRVLVATDIAARGLDIDQLPQVVNFDLPHVAEDYVHRIGRTGRAGATGQAVSLVSADEVDDLRGIERLIQQLIPREYVDGFEPVHEVPESKLDTRPIKSKKPKKPKKPRAQDGQAGEQSGGKSAEQARQKKRSGGHRDGQRSGENALGHNPVAKSAQHKRRKPKSYEKNNGKSHGDTSGGQREVNGNRADKATHENRSVDSWIATGEGRRRSNGGRGNGKNANAQNRKAQSKPGASGQKNGRNRKRNTGKQSQRDDNWGNR